MTAAAVIDEVKAEKPRDRDLRSDLRSAVEEPCGRVDGRALGYKCPSGVLMLKWSDVNFGTGRMTVPSCKTEQIPGKECRVVPIFAALPPHPDEAFKRAAPGGVYVVGTEQGGRYRAAAQGPSGWMSCNLRTQFLKLIKRAGPGLWLFHTPGHRARRTCWSGSRSAP